MLSLAATIQMSEIEVIFNSAKSFLKSNNYFLFNFNFLNLRFIF